MAVEILFSGWNNLEKINFTSNWNADSLRSKCCLKNPIYYFNKREKCHILKDFYWIEIKLHKQPIS